MKNCWGVTLLRRTYWKPDIVLNGQWSGRHSIGGVMYLDLDTVLSE
jgi:hypothetical protein